GRFLTATSIGNLVRLCRPAVILDEGHKATSDLARKTIEGFNPSVIVELSATPQQGANILTRVNGQELLDEEMIKLPLNVATSGQKAWRDVLTQARDKRLALAEIANQHVTSAGPDQQIRPIVLVQVERTGKDQEDSQYIHSRQVKAYLIERLGVPEQAIAIKSADKDDIEGLDLLDPGCPVEWIITKSALQEGWDCPFAYILVSLNNTGSSQSMTQLVGRVLRQPFQQRTPFRELNESYIYCLHKRAADISREVKKALENEGYEGNIESAVVDVSRGQEVPLRTVKIQQKFLNLYGRPFKGKIYLPHFCVKVDGDHEQLDYFRHLVSKVDVAAFAYDKINWPLQDALVQAKDRFYRITLGEDISRMYETDVDIYENDRQVQAWLAASLSFIFLSHKQLRYVVARVYDRLCQTELMLDNRLALVKFVVRNKIQDFVQGELDRQTEAAFREIHASGNLEFYLECTECRFQVPPSIQIRSTRRLLHADGRDVAKSLFDYVEHDAVNEFERAVALCLDRHSDVLWWYRNLVGPEHFAIQGYQRHRIRPDFVVQGGTEERPIHRVLVIESKGRHLEGNPDTTYKQDVASLFNDVGRSVTWQELGEDFENHVFRFQVLDEAQPFGRDWTDELQDVVSALAAG
ncbi:MAG TPA: hypothetical protein VGH74_00285, partial [Planctomycetaceae bacterium]